jgi:hypothetical protein
MATFTGTLPNTDTETLEVETATNYDFRRFTYAGQNNNRLFFPRGTSPTAP